MCALFKKWGQMHKQMKKRNGLWEKPKSQLNNLCVKLDSV